MNDKPSQLSYRIHPDDSAYRWTVVAGGQELASGTASDTVQARVRAIRAALPLQLEHAR